MIAVTANGWRSWWQNGNRLLSNPPSELIAKAEGECSVDAAHGRVFMKALWLRFTCPAHDPFTEIVANKIVEIARRARTAIFGGELLLHMQQKRKSFGFPS